MSSVVAKPSPVHHGALHHFVFLVVGCDSSTGGSDSSTVVSNSSTGGSNSSTGGSNSST